MTDRGASCRVAFTTDRGEPVWVLAVGVWVAPLGTTDPVGTGPWVRLDELQALATRAGVSPGQT